MAREFSVQAKSFKFEFFRKVGPLIKVSELSKMKVFSLVFGLHEFSWITAQLQAFFMEKGGKNWVKVFRGSSKIIVLRLSNNERGRFIVLEVLEEKGKGRRLCFPEGEEAVGWRKLVLMLTLCVEKPLVTAEEKKLTVECHGTIPPSSKSCLAEVDNVLQRGEQGGRRAFWNRATAGLSYGKEKKRKNGLEKELSFEKEKEKKEKGGKFVNGTFPKALESGRRHGEEGIRMAGHGKQESYVQKLGSDYSYLQAILKGVTKGREKMGLGFAKNGSHTLHRDPFRSSNSKQSMNSNGKFVNGHHFQGFSYSTKRGTVMAEGVEVVGRGRGVSSKHKSREISRGGRSLKTEERDLGREGGACPYAENEIRELKKENQKRGGSHLGREEWQPAGSFCGIGPKLFYNAWQQLFWDKARFKEKAITYNKAGPGILGPYPSLYSMGPIFKPQFHFKKPTGASVKTQRFHSARVRKECKTAAEKKWMARGKKPGFLEKTSRMKMSWVPKVTGIISVNSENVDRSSGLDFEAGKNPISEQKTRQPEEESMEPGTLKVQEQITSGSPSRPSYSSPSKQAVILGLKKVTFIEKAIEDLRKEFKDKEESLSSEDEESVFFSAVEDGILSDEWKAQSSYAYPDSEGECLRGLFCDDESCLPKDAAQPESFPEGSSSISHNIMLSSLKNPLSLNSDQNIPFPPSCFKSGHNEKTNFGNCLTGPDMKEVSVTESHQAECKKTIFAHDLPTKSWNYDSLKNHDSEPIASKEGFEDPNSATLLKKMGLQLINCPGMSMDNPSDFAVYRRKPKRGVRELKNLESSVNYGVASGRKGRELNRSQ